MAPFELLRAFGALGLVFGLIALGAWVLKRSGLNFGAATMKKKGEDRLIQVIEITPLDHRRKLALIRCRDEEHLILLSPTNETLIKAGDKP